MEFSCKWNSVEISMRMGDGVEHGVLLHKVEKKCHYMFRFFLSNKICYVGE